MNAKLTFAERIGRYPFLRLAIPLIIGMACAAYSYWSGMLLSQSFLVVGFLFLCFLFGGLFFIRCRLLSIGKNDFFGWTVMLFFFLFGFLHYQLACRRVTVDWPERKEVYRALLVTSPEFKTRSIMCEALVVPDGDELSDWRSAPKVMLVFRKNEQSELLHVGDGLVFKEQIKVPVNRGNPDEFDYTRFLFNRGLSGQVLLWNATWKVCSSDEMEAENIPLAVRLRIMAQQCRDWFLLHYETAGLSGDEFALYSAMTLGDRSEMPQSLRQIYAAAGVSHVLALSGLHLCYLVALLGFLLKCLVRRRVAYVIGILLAIVLVWCFCILAGMPSSLVRASLMYSLMLLGTLAERKGFSVNSLAASAFLMLCFSPLWLFDVSFQLSFLAMCGIFGLGTVRLPQILQQYRPVRFVSESLLMSFKAQLTTSPLVACLFHTFSPYSALSTLLLTPFTAILLCSMPLSMLLAVLPSDWSVMWFSSLAYVIRTQHVILETIAGWPLSVIQLFPSPVMIAVIYLFMILWLCRHHLKFTVYIWNMVLLFVAFVVASWFNVVDRIKPVLIFYNCPSCPSAHFILSSKKSYLLPIWPDSVSRHMTDISRTFWERRLTVSPQVVNKDYNDGDLWADNGLVKCAGRTVLLVFDGRWTGGYAQRPYPIDYLFVCRGMCTSLEDLSRLFIPRLVILDASLRWADCRLYKRQCEMLGWSVYDMSVSGALKVPLK